MVLEHKNQNHVALCLALYNLCYGIINHQVSEEHFNNKNFHCVLCEAIMEYLCEDAAVKAKPTRYF